MNKPNYVKVDNKLYKINTDFRVAIECNDIASDKNIGDYERVLAIIYKLFGEEGMACENQQKLIELAIQYLSFNGTQKGLNDEPRKDYELDFKKCEGLIESSFKFDYGYSPYELEYIHWYDFYNDLENLSTSEFGTCCILNRVISILEIDTNKIKDSKEKKKAVDAKKVLMQKYCINNEKEITKEEEESAKAFYKSLGIDL